MRPTTIEAPAVQPPRYGLLASARTTEETSAAMGAGITWVPRMCGVSGRDAIDCFGSTASRALDVERPPDANESIPFAVWTAIECSAPWSQGLDFLGEVREQLAATESYEVANELWTGDLASTDAENDTFYLASTASDTLTNGGVAPIAALACLEQGLAQCAKGRRGMIHLTPQLLVQLMALRAVTQAGGLYLSPLGNIVVPDAGYDGSGPDGSAAGATQWAYATGMVSVRLGVVQTYPESLLTDEGLTIAMDIGDNTERAWAQRTALYQVDDCCHLAAEVDLPVCLVGGAS